MRKRVTIQSLLVVLFAIVSLTAFADDKDSTKNSFSIGGHIGINNASVSSGIGRTDLFSYTPGINIGAVANYCFPDLFSVQLELNLIQKGFGAGSHNSNAVALNYLELPILAKVLFGENKLSGFINIGPTFGYALSANDNRDVLASNISFGSNFKRFELGFIAGAGAGYKIGIGMITLEARYGFGLTELAKDSNAKNKGVVILFGYIIPIK
jgi:hypothetical protein